MLNKLLCVKASKIKSLIIYIFEGIGLCMSSVLAAFGLDPTKIQTDKLHSVLNSEGILTAYLRLVKYINV